MIQKNKNWMKISLGALALSILSLFLPVIYYQAGAGNDKYTQYSFNIVELLEGSDFVKKVLAEYRGDFLHGMGASHAEFLLLLLCLVGIAAIVLSFWGLKSMAKQYESVWPFRLTLAGIVCTAVPALVLLMVVAMSGGDFPGTLRAGAYAYVTPLAMVVSCITTVRRHRLSREELAVQKQACAYIYPAGDLPEW